MITFYSQLMIPGSHDVGAIGRFSSYFSGSIGKRHSVTQDQSAWNQLVWGVRFLDLSVAHVADDPHKFLLTNGGANFGPLKALLG